MDRVQKQKTLRRDNKKEHQSFTLQHCEKSECAPVERLFEVLPFLFRWHCLLFRSIAAILLFTKPEHRVGDFTVAILQPHQCIACRRDTIVLIYLFRNALHDPMTPAPFVKIKEINRVPTHTQNV